MVVISVFKSGVPGDPDGFLQLPEREGASRSCDREPGGSALCKITPARLSSPSDGLGASGPGAFSGRVPSEPPAAAAHLPPRCSRGRESLGGVRFRLQITSELQIRAVPPRAVSCQIPLRRLFGCPCECRSCRQASSGNGGGRGRGLRCLRAPPCSRKRTLNALSIIEQVI